MIKAIETTYDGLRLRSRLEARWCVFFKTLGIPYEYEKEGYPLPSGNYLPDFWLPTVGLRESEPGLWLEVKPVIPSVYEYTVAAELRAATHSNVVIACGLPRSSEQPADGIIEVSPTQDNFMLFMKCYTCGRVKVEFCESNYCICPDCGALCDDQHPMIQAAELAAKQARFEHGECG